MRKIWVAVAAVAVLAPATWAQNVAPTDATKSPVIDTRQENQQQRIGQGVQNGSLTAGEAARLERKEAAIDRQENRMKSDGTFTASERARIRREQRAMSKRIYAQKHDAQRQAPAVGRVETRDRAQQQRIGQGIQNGSLTAAEAARLETREARLQREQRRLRAQNGGTLDPQDKARINRQQNRLSNSIYRQKHDLQRRR